MPLQTATKKYQILRILDQARHSYATEVVTRHGMRQWKKFHKSNKESRSDCQLVTALNAYYYLYGKTIGQDTKTYEKLTDLCGARHGAAISIDKVYKRLKIKADKVGTFWGFSSTEKAKKWLPLEASIWHKAYGFHSILIVDYEPKTDAIRVLNADKLGEVNLQGWIFREDFQHYEKDPNKGWIFRNLKRARKPRS